MLADHLGYQTKTDHCQKYMKRFVIKNIILHFRLKNLSESQLRSIPQKGLSLSK